MLYEIVFLNLIRVCENTVDTRIDTNEHIYYNAEEAQYECHSICSTGHDDRSIVNNGYLHMKPAMSTQSHNSSIQQDIYNPNTSIYQIISSGSDSTFSDMSETSMGPPIVRPEVVKTVPVQAETVITFSKKPNFQRHVTTPSEPKNILDNATRNHLVSIYQQNIYQKMKRLIRIGFVMLFIFGVLSIFLSVILSLMNNNLTENKQTQTFTPRDINFTTKVELIEPVDLPLVPITPKVITTISPSSRNEAFFLTQLPMCSKLQYNFTSSENDPFADEKDKEFPKGAFQGLLTLFRERYHRIFKVPDVLMKNYLIDRFNDYKDFNTELINYINDIKDSKKKERVCWYFLKLFHTYRNIIDKENP